MFEGRFPFISFAAGNSVIDVVGGPVAAERLKKSCQESRVQFLFRRQNKFDAVAGGYLTDFIQVQRKLEHGKTFNFVFFMEKITAKFAEWCFFMGKSYDFEVLHRVFKFQLQMSFYGESDCHG